MTPHRCGLLAACAVMALSSATAAAEPAVIASIKPVHSLVASVMEGVGEPDLIVDGAGSPHNYSLKPSQARALENAEVVFWIGHEMEVFLEKPIETIGSKATVVELVDAHGLTRLALREGGFFDEHDHEHGDGEAHAEHGGDDHAHEEEHAEHGHDDHDHDEKHAEHGDEDHAHEEEHAEHGDEDHAHEEEHAEHGHDDHDHDEKHAEHGEFDAHIWLDPQNAKAMVQEIAEALSKADPDNAARYKSNAEATLAQLDALTDEVATALEPVSGKPFIVFHDAYQNFENRFGVNAVGSITVSPEVIPGAERISDIHEKLKDAEAVCVFSEPQFEPRIIDVVTEGTDANSGVLDPLGAAIPNGPDLYFTLIRNMADSICSCLSKES